MQLFHIFFKLCTFRHSNVHAKMIGVPASSLFKPSKVFIHLAQIKEFYSCQLLWPKRLTRRTTYYKSQEESWLKKKNIVPTMKLTENVAQPLYHSALGKTYESRLNPTPTNVGMSEPASNSQSMSDVVKHCSKKPVVGDVEASTSYSSSTALFSSLVCKKTFFSFTMFVSCVDCPLLSISFFSFLK